MSNPPRSYSAQKQALRKKIALLKKNRAKEETAEKSALIKNALFQTPEFKKAKAILLYASIDGEVQTKSMIGEALSLGKRVALPKVSGSGLTLHAISNPCGLEKSTLGIPEPKTARTLSLGEMDLLILPGLAFDRTGNRLGRGGGYYDRLLSNANPEIPKFALAFRFQLLEALPSSNTDRKVDAIITEGGLVRCKR